jgi:hypothetical protein
MSPIIGSKSGLSASAYGFTANIKPVVTGGTLSSDATYYYRAFTSTGTLSVTLLNLTADVLIIAGGGGGSTINAGGAGGLRYFPGLTLGTTYTCTVGTGGAGANGAIAPFYGAKGTNTSFIGGAYSYTTTGGGGTNTNNAGGSGGGADGLGNQGGYTPPEGYNALTGSAYAYSGGGAGGSASGGAVSPGQASTPGPGVSTYSSWGAATGIGDNVSGTYWFAGGGGAGSDVFQGINGASNASGATGANTGGGGKGGDRDAAGTYFSGSNGQNGVIIVRYLKSAV